MENYAKEDGFRFVDKEHPVCIPSNLPCEVKRFIEEEVKRGEPMCNIFRAAEKELL